MTLIYYIKYDVGDMRPFKVYNFDLNTKKHTLIYHETNSSYQLGLTGTSDNKYICIACVSRRNVEVIIITPCGIKRPFPRKDHHFYTIHHRQNVWYVLEKNNGESKIKTSRDLIKFDVLFDFKRKLTIRFFFY